MTSNARKRSALAALALALIAGVWFLKDKREQDCLDTARQYLDLPSSARFIANLGKRGDMSYEGFWIHYAEKTSRGADIEQAMACRGESLVGPWQYDGVHELTLSLRLADKLAADDRFRDKPEAARWEEAERLIYRPTKLVPRAIRTQDR